MTVSKRYIFGVISRSPLSLCCAFALSAIFVSARPSKSAEAVNFNRDIRKILSDNCFKCHGPDEKERKGGKKGARLRLDTPEGAQMDLGGKQAIVPGHPEKSELVKRITSTDPDEKMPPPESGKKLTETQIAQLQNWI